MTPTVVYEDDQGSMIDYPDDDYVEIRWYDASSEFAGETFNRRQEVIASVVEQCGRSHILIDAVQFGMNAEEMDIEWRDANTVPRFNAAGVKRQALIVPAGFPSHWRTTGAGRASRLSHRLLRHASRSPSVALIVTARPPGA